MVVDVFSSTGTVRTTSAVLCCATMCYGISGTLFTVQHVILNMNIHKVSGNAIVGATNDDEQSPKSHEHS